MARFTSSVTACQPQTHAHAPLGQVSAFWVVIDRNVREGEALSELAVRSSYGADAHLL